MSRGLLEADVICTAAVAAWLGFAVWASYSVFVTGSVEGFFVGELDVETFAIPQVLIFIGSGVGRTMTLALGMAAIGLYATLADPVHYGKRLLHLPGRDRACCSWQGACSWSSGTSSRRTRYWPSVFSSKKWLSSCLCPDPAFIDRGKYLLG